MKPERALTRGDFPEATGIGFSVVAGILVWTVIAIAIALGL